MTSALTKGLSGETLAQFKVLQHHFIAGLSARWLEITAAKSPQARQAALHRLAGSAGGYGFERMCECAREAESLSVGEADAPLTQVLTLLEVEIVRAQATVQEVTPLRQV